MESAFDKQMSGILKVMNNGTAIASSRPSSDLSCHYNKEICNFILFILVMFITLKNQMENCMLTLCGWRWVYQTQKKT